jgi:hypothetical protein
MPSTPDTNEWSDHFDKLDRAARWMYFLDFSSARKDKVIAKILGAEVMAEDKIFAAMREKVIDKVKDWKHKMINAAQVSKGAPSHSLYVNLVLIRISSRSLSQLTKQIMGLEHWLV